MKHHHESSRGKRWSLHFARHVADFTCLCVSELGANIDGNGGAEGRGGGGRAEREEESTSGVSTYNSQHSHPDDPGASALHRSFVERLESRDGGAYLQLRQLEDENRRSVPASLLVPFCI